MRSISDGGASWRVMIRSVCCNSVTRAFSLASSSRVVMGSVEGLEFPDAAVLEHEAIAADLLQGGEGCAWGVNVGVTHPAGGVGVSKGFRLIADFVGRVVIVQGGGWVDLVTDGG
jgi:hypothetical protein